MIKPILTAAIVSMTIMSAAAALPVAPAQRPSAGTASDLVQVGAKYKGNKHYKHYNKKYHGKGHGRYHPGYRYHDAPRNWHRYSYRPYDWEDRGCIIVGPLWFCP